jgi:hypothetical protein
MEGGYPFGCLLEGIPASWRIVALGPALAIEEVVVAGRARDVEDLREMRAGVELACLRSFTGREVIAARRTRLEAHGSVRLVSFRLALIVLGVPVPHINSDFPVPISRC